MGRIIEAYDLLNIERKRKQFLESLERDLISIVKHKYDDEPLLLLNIKFKIETIPKNKW